MLDLYQNKYGWTPESADKFKYVKERNLQKDSITWKPEDRYIRPNPFDPKHDLTYFDGDETTFAGREFDRVIDYGSRRERLRQNFEWELDRVYLEEEIQIRRRKECERDKQQADSSTQQEAEKKGDETAKANSTLPEPKPQYLDWYKYIEPHLREDQEMVTRGIVDVLLGEPVVVVETQSFRGWFCFSSQKLGAQRKPLATKLH